MKPCSFPGVNYYVMRSRNRGAKGLVPDQKHPCSVDSPYVNFSTMYYFSAINTNIRHLSRPRLLKKKELTYSN
ncbi:hypothetical protein pdam_00020740 [Pocillopora damicornis]|uniref:Uncharacterized protein n=1 Tax=Pocillopora damicornis TaxID=46731 RepID=A0A3M6TWI8_POCDA|nr:hypothetical protein pdam_00020740 [Pocillopora damicornis]